MAGLKRVLIAQSVAIGAAFALMVLLGARVQPLSDLAATLALAVFMSALAFLPSNIICGGDASLLYEFWCAVEPESVGEGVRVLLSDMPRQHHPHHTPTIDLDDAGAAFGARPPPTASSPTGSTALPGFATAVARGAAVGCVLCAWVGSVYLLLDAETLLQQYPLAPAAGACAGAVAGAVTVAARCAAAQAGVRCRRARKAKAA